MTFLLVTQFHVLTVGHHSVLHVKALIGAFNQEKALVGAFSVIVTTDGSFAALVTSGRVMPAASSQHEAAE